MTNWNNMDPASPYFGYRQEHIDYLKHKEELGRKNDAHFAEWHARANAEAAEIRNRRYAQEDAQTQFNNARTLQNDRFEQENKMRQMEMKMQQMQQDMERMKDALRRGGR